MMEVVPLTIGQNDSDRELRFDLSFRALANQRDGSYFKDVVGSISRWQRSRRYRMDFTKCVTDAISSIVQEKRLVTSP